MIFDQLAILSLGGYCSPLDDNGLVASGGGGATVDTPMKVAEAGMKERHRRVFNSRVFPSLFEDGKMKEMKDHPKTSPLSLEMSQAEWEEAIHIVRNFGPALLSDANEEQKAFRKSLGKKKEKKWTKRDEGVPLIEKYKVEEYTLPDSDQTHHRLLKRHKRASWTEEKWLLCIPQLDVFDAISECHGIASHMKQNQTCVKVHEKYYNVTEAQVIAFVESCETCNHANPVVTDDEVRNQQIHESRTSMTDDETKFRASCSSIIPNLFFGVQDDTKPKIGRPELSAMKTFRMFDAGDGVHGIFNFVMKQLPRVKKDMDTTIGSLLAGHPELALIAKGNVRRSCTFIQDFFRFMRDQYNELLQKCYGEGPYTKAQKAEIWDLMLLMFRVVWDTLWETRQWAKSAHVKPGTALEVYLESCLKTHMQMEIFVERGFIEHSGIFPKLTRHLFETTVSKEAFDAVQATLDTLVVEHNELKRKYDRLSTRRATHCCCHSASCARSKLQRPLECKIHAPGGATWKEAVRSIPGP